MPQNILDSSTFSLSTAVFATKLSADITSAIQVVMTGLELLVFAVCGFLIFGQGGKKKE